MRRLRGQTASSLSDFPAACNLEFTSDGYNGGMSAHFKAVDRETIYLFPPSVQDWLPEKPLFLQILLLAKTLGFLKMGKISEIPSGTLYNPQLNHGAPLSNPSGIVVKPERENRH